MSTLYREFLNNSLSSQGKVNISGPKTLVESITLAFSDGINVLF